MIGRYGPDQLNLTLFLLFLVLALAATLTGFFALTIVSYVPFFVSVFRMLSRNIKARRRENDRFLTVITPLKTRVKRRFTALREIKTHKYFACPGCKKSLRVPRGKGRLQITCPKCGLRFMRNSGK